MRLLFPPFLGTLQLAAAAVNFYGFIGDQGGSVSCSSIEFDDNALADLLEIDKNLEGVRSD